MRNWSEDSQGREADLARSLDPNVARVNNARYTRGFLTLLCGFGMVLIAGNIATPTLSAITAVAGALLAVVGMVSLRSAKPQSRRPI